MKYDFFVEYLRFSSTQNTPGAPTISPEGHRARPPPRARPLTHGPHVAPSTYSSTHSLRLPPEKNPPIAQTHVLAHLAAIFDLLAQSTSHKTALGDCSLVCDSSNGPSFCSSALFIANFCYLGDPVLELACQIYMVPSNSNA